MSRILEADISPLGPRGRPLSVIIWTQHAGQTAFKRLIDLSNNFPQKVKAIKDASEATMGC